MWGSLKCVSRRISAFFLIAIDVAVLLQKVMSIKVAVANWIHRVMKRKVSKLKTYRRSDEQVVAPAIFRGNFLKPPPRHQTWLEEAWHDGPPTNEMASSAFAHLPSPLPPSVARMIKPSHHLPSFLIFYSQSTQCGCRTQSGFLLASVLHL